MNCVPVSSLREHAVHVHVAQPEMVSQISTPHACASPLETTHARARTLYLRTIVSGQRSLGPLARDSWQEPETGSGELLLWPGGQGHRRSLLPDPGLQSPDHLNATNLTRVSATGPQACCTYDPHVATFI